MTNPVGFYPVILAGGSGTRFWPRSRRARAKQVLALDGDRTMIQRTLDRLEKLATSQQSWIITNQVLAGEIASQLPGIPAAQIVQEPAARNTAPACGLAAFLIERIDPDAVLGIFSSDHVIEDEERFQQVVEKGIALAAAGANMVVLGVQPSRPETGYGYIETGAATDDPEVLHVRRFTEKPNLKTAEEFVAAGNFYWNSGMFIWSARTLANALRKHLPNTVPYLEKIAAAFGTPEFDQVFAENYALCENISVDYAVLEPVSALGEAASNLYCLPAEFGWSDLGSWESLFEFQRDNRAAADADGNVAATAGHMAVKASNNYIFSPKKFAVLMGVKDIVVVETEDAILVMSREESQNVGKIVKELSAQKREDLV